MNFEKFSSDKSTCDESPAGPLCSNNGICINVESQMLGKDDFSIFYCLCQNGFKGTQ